jgi:hypothetical protein
LSSKYIVTDVGVFSVFYTFFFFASSAHFKLQTGPFSRIFFFYHIILYFIMADDFFFLRWGLSYIYFFFRPLSSANVLNKLFFKLPCIDFLIQKCSFCNNSKIKIFGFFFIATPKAGQQLILCYPNNFYNLMMDVYFEFSQKIHTLIFNAKPYNFILYFRPVLSNAIVSISILFSFFFTLRECDVQNRIHEDAIKNQSRLKIGLVWSTCFC